jgi:hypothetical protein
VHERPSLEVRDGAVVRLAVAGDVGAVHGDDDVATPQAHGGGWSSARDLAARDTTLEALSHKRSDRAVAHRRMRG